MESNTKNKNSINLMLLTQWQSQFHFTSALFSGMNGKRMGSLQNLIIREGGEEGEREGGVQWRAESKRESIVHLFVSVFHLDKYLTVKLCQA